MIMNRIAFLSQIQQECLSSSVNLVEQFYGLATRRFSNAAASSHLFDVLRVVARFSQDINVLEAALLHDLLEDFPETKSIVSAQCCERVNHLVSLLTKPACRPQESRTQRNGYYWCSLATDSDALLIKLADTLSNVPREGDPVHFKARFHSEKSLFLSLVSGNVKQSANMTVLFKELSAAIDEIKQ
jgi:(p)ppGpp synthase/HD superfamily hydrolase